jgi:predicted O-methyltransferase YrrM
MERKKLIIPFLKYLFTKPSVILKSLHNSVTQQSRKDLVKNKYGFGKGLPQINLLDLIPSFNEEVENCTHLDGTSMPIDIALLKALAKKHNNCEYLEIGTWRGESIYNLSKVSKHCTSLSLSNKEMIAFGLTEKHTKVQRLFSKNLSNVTHIEHNSLTFNFSSLNKKFDLIFVDGDHTYEAVKSDTKNVFNLLKDENSIIIWHDYTRNYEQLNWPVIAGILDGSPKEAINHIYQVSNTLCAIYTKQKFNTVILDSPTFPDKAFTVSISGKKI